MVSVRVTRCDVAKAGDSFAAHAGLWKRRERKLINSNRSGVSRKMVPGAGEEWSRRKPR